MARWNTPQRMLLFYAVSLLLSLITIVVATTLFIVVIYINKTVSTPFLLLFALVMAINLGILLLSLRGVLKHFYLLYEGSGRHKIVIGNQVKTSLTPRSSSDESYLTQTEAIIIDLIRDNNGRILQNSIPSALKISKASVSRALTSLENKGFIIRIRKGVTNEILLSETGSI